ncbi:MAG: acyl-ACP--UDP-N-acetylglucosamine O-acyltransferase [Deltaproteobacteria bacterium]|nr:acyl-ACP--UDP-N-acetylglucosamine O-acyltransferase [Deltaproteobacteria bacterium]MBN2673609.1 acyl-ACP--UDP-N-acetylglucosamine O-acyltransferase [Deltaproteobacteria bacterium]
MGANLTLVNQEQRRDVEIDPRASVHSDAQLGEGCRIGPFAVVGEGVTLGKNCTLQAHAVVTGPTRMGNENEVYSFACIGGAPQDLRHRGEATELIVGDGNAFREHVTVGRGTVHGGGKTVIGNDNLIMAYCHIAHDCIIGNNVVMANNATLAGHVQVQDFAVFGGMVAVASFVRIGESAMLAAGSLLEKDVPPYAMVAGDRAVLKGVNRVGISRRGFSDSAKRDIKMIIKALKYSRTSLAEIIESVENTGPLSMEAERLIAFLRERQRSITR